MNTEETKWFSPKDKLPDFSDDIEVSFDNGKTWDDSVSYMENRTCMMAGIAGGNGYFGKGWGMNGNNGCDKGLISETPNLWRLL